ncbi:MAG: peptidyl-prolyl cis-trans isomerase [Roseburia sp.]
MERKKTVYGRWCRFLSVVGVLCMLWGVAGCQIGKHDIVVSGTMGSRQIFQIGGKVCHRKEAMVYLANYQNIYGTSYSIDLWQHDFGDDSLEQYVKDITIEELAQVICMDLLAESQALTLSEEELKKVSRAAEEYYATLSEEEIAYMGMISESDINEYYQHYALAQKLYHSLTNGVNGEVSDDEARVIEIMQIYVTDQQKAGEVSGKLGDGEDFASVANNYNELSAIQITVARDDLPDAVEQVAFNLDNDEVSGAIEADSGYYFIKCLNKYDVELTEANKSNIVEKREKEAFYDVYNAFVSGLPSSMDEEEWDAVEINTGEDITTDSFFEVFEKYCSDI